MRHWKAVCGLVVCLMVPSLGCAQGAAATGDPVTSESRALAA